MSDYIFECKSLCKNYGKKKVIENLYLKISKGKIVGLIGINGCGKSTLINLANGLLTKSSGEVLIDGMKPSLDSKKIVSYLPDKNYLGQFNKVKDAFDFFCDFYEDFNKNKALEMLAKLYINLDDKIKILSKGTQEKLQLVLVMCRDSKLYFLDEPVAGVDPASRDYILDALIRKFKNDSTVIITTHLIQEIENILDEIVIIKDGKVFMHKSIDEVRENEGKSINTLFREVFKC